MDCASFHLFERDKPKNLRNDSMRCVSIGPFLCQCTHHQLSATNVEINPVCPAKLASSSSVESLAPPVLAQSFQDFWMLEIVLSLPSTTDCKANRQVIFDLFFHSKYLIFSIEVYGTSMFLLKIHHVYLYTLC